MNARRDVEEEAKEWQPSGMGRQLHAICRRGRRGMTMLMAEDPWKAMRAAINMTWDMPGRAGKAIVSKPQGSTLKTAEQDAPGDNYQGRKSPKLPCFNCRCKTARERRRGHAYRGSCNKGYAGIGRNKTPSPVMELLQHHHRSE